MSQVGDGSSSSLAGTDAAQVGRLRDFLSGHGGTTVAVINYIGRIGARIVVVAEDGAYGDAVASTVEAANEICSQAGIEVADGWTRELSAKITPSAADRRRMAGTGR